jgi:hypothetical protein
MGTANDGGSCSSAVVAGEHRQVPAGGMTQDADPCGVDAVFGRVVEDPTERSLDVADFVTPAFRRRHAVLDVEHGVAEFVQPAVPPFRFAAGCHPAASVHDNDGWVPFSVVVGDSPHVHLEVVPSDAVPYTTVRSGCGRPNAGLACAR